MEVVVVALPGSSLELEPHHKILYNFIVRIVIYLFFEGKKKKRRKRVREGLWWGVKIVIISVCDDEEVAVVVKNQAKPPIPNAQVLRPFVVASSPFGFSEQNPLT